MAEEERTSTDLSRTLHFCRCPLNLDDAFDSRARCSALAGLPQPRGTRRIPPPNTGVSHVYLCAYRHVYPCHPPGRAGGKLCQGTDSRSYHVYTCRPATCTRVSHPISGLLRTVQRLCWSAGILLPFLNYLLVRSRLLYSRRSTQSKEDTRPWVLSQTFGFSVVASRRSSHSLCDSPRAHLFPRIPPLFLPRAATEDPTVPTRVCVALLGYCARVALCLFCAYLPRSSARTPLPVITGWSPVSYSTRVPNTRALPEATTVASVHDTRLDGNRRGRDAPTREPAWNHLRPSVLGRVPGLLQGVEA